MGLVWYGLVWCGTGMVWYGMVSHILVSLWLVHTGGRWLEREASVAQCLASTGEKVAGNRETGLTPSGRSTWASVGELDATCGRVNLKQKGKKEISRKSNLGK